MVHKMKFLVAWLRYSLYENNDIYYNNENELSNNGLQKIKINRKNIFPKKKQNSIKDAIKLNNKNVQNINVNEINKRNNDYQLLNNNKIKNSYNIEDKNINNINNNNCIGPNIYSKNLNSEKRYAVNQNRKIIDKDIKMPNFRNNLKSQNNTINNISNFNNCNYIYLFNK